MKIISYLIIILGLAGLLSLIIYLILGSLYGFKGGEYKDKIVKCYDINNNEIKGVNCIEKIVDMSTIPIYNHLLIVTLVCWIITITLLTLSRGDL